MRKLSRQAARRLAVQATRSPRPWESTDWTHGRNVSQLLEFLWAQGKVLVSAREGRERVRDLAERVAKPLRELKTWLGAGETVYGRVPRAWAPSLD